MKRDYVKNGNNGPDGGLLVGISHFFRPARYSRLLRNLLLSSRQADLTPWRIRSRYRPLLMISAMFLFGGCNRNGADRMVANAPGDAALRQVNEQTGQGRMS